MHTLFRFILLSFLFTLLLAACSSNLTLRPPTGLTATPGEGQVTLRWQDNSDAETGYAIYRQEVSSAAGLNTQQAEDFEQIDITPPDTEVYVDETVAPNMRYRYGISAEGRYGSRRVTTPEATPEVNPNPTNRAPTAQGQTVSTAQGRAVGIVLSGTDPEGQTLSYTLTSQPQRGTLSGEAPNLTYTPNRNYSGPDSFTFTVSDGSSISEEATVTVNILAEDAPYNLVLSNNTARENQPAGTVVGTLLALDDDSTSFIYSLPAGEADNDQFRVEGDQLLTAAPFDFEAVREYTVIAEVLDEVGNPYREGFVITVEDVDEVDEEDPSVTFENPGTLLKDNRVALRGTATDDLSVTRVTLYEVRDGAETELGEAILRSSSWSYSYTPQAVGSYALKAVAEDTAGKDAEADVMVTVGDIIVTNTNDSGSGSLRQVLLDADAGDTVVFDLEPQDRTVTLQSQLTLTKDVTVAGENIAVSGSDQVRVFNVDSGVTAGLRGLTVTRGNTSGSPQCSASTLSAGGGICNLGTLTLTDVMVNNNTSVRGGGGISNSGALILQGVSSVGGNTASNGGGIENYDGSVTLRDDVSIENNTASGIGGGIYNEESTLTLEDNASVSGNAAGRDGGGVINFDSSTLTMQDNASISGNTASSGSGGGVYNDDGTVTLRGGSRIRNNEADDGGGGVYLEGGSLTLLDDARIRGNKGDGGGGVSNADSGIVTLQNRSSIRNNQSTFSGGGVYNSSNGTLTLENRASISDNTGSAGGGVFNGGTFTMSGNSSISSNTANQGGGVENGTGATLTMSSQASIRLNTATDNVGGGVRNTGAIEMNSSSSISENSASGNGGGVQSESGTLTMRNSSSISSNTSTSSGGGVHNEGSALTLQGSASISSNIASNDGGGVYNDNSGTFTLRGSSSIADNEARDGGGAYSNGIFTLRGSSSISGNTANREGGGVFSGGTLELRNSASISNNTAVSNGGGVVDNRGTLTGADYEDNDIGGDGVYNIFGNTPNQVYVD